MVKQKLNYVKRNIKKLQYIDSVDKSKDTLRFEDILKNVKEVDIDTKNYNKLNLRENGVEFVNLDTNLKKLIKQISKFSIEQETSKEFKKLRNEIEKNVGIYLNNFLQSKSKSGVKNFSKNYSDVLVLESAVRASAIKSFAYDKKTNTAARWFHTDWWEGQSFSSMIESRFQWLDKLKKISDKKYTDIKNIDNWGCFWDSKYVELINVWIPFSSTTEAAPLVFSDMNNTEYDDIIPYTYKVYYGPNNSKHYYEIATRLRYNKNQKLYSKEDMKPGEAIIFTSNRTPHSAYFTKKNKVTRRSMEFRCAVLNFDTKKSNDALSKLYKKNP